MDPTKSLVGHQTAWNRIMNRFGFFNTQYLRFRKLFIPIQLNYNNFGIDQINMHA